MIAVFYDRKHDCEVTSKQLMHINFVAEVKRTDYGYHDLQLGEFGYKSSECKKKINWDRGVMFTDLVFIRLEDEG
jgi:hypothetical protein